MYKRQDVDYASEYRYRNPIPDRNALGLLITQSGETADTLAAQREMIALGSKTVAICNVVDAMVAREAVSYTHLDVYKRQAWAHAGATNNPAEPLKAASKPNTDATTVADLVLSLRGSRLNLVLGVEPTISSALTLTRPPRDKEARKAVWSSGAGLPLSVQRSRKWECVHTQAARCSSPFQPVPLESPYVRNCRIRRSQEGGSSHH